MLDTQLCDKGMEWHWKETYNKIGIFNEVVDGAAILHVYVNGFGVRMLYEFLSLVKNIASYARLAI